MKREEVRKSNWDKIMPHNCCVCNYSKAFSVGNGRCLLVCDCEDSREYQNMVDKYVHCGHWVKLKDDM